MPSRLREAASPAFHTAVVLVCISLAVLLLRADARPARLTTVAGLLIAVSALTALLGSVGWGDHAVFGELVDSRAMTATTSAALAMASVAAATLLVPSRSRPLVALREALSILVVALPTFVLVGRVVGVDAHSTAEHAGRMLVLTSLLLVALGLLLMAASPAGPIARIVRDDSAGGSLARRLIPAAVLVPICFGFLRVRAQKAGIVDLEQAVQLMVLATTVTFLLMVLWVASRLAASDHKFRSLAQEHELFAGVSAHEMRTPLVAIRNFADIMSTRWDDIADEDRRAYTAIIGGQARRLLDMVSDLLIASQIMSGGVSGSCRVRDLELAQAVGDVLREVDEPVTLDVEDGPTVRADADHLRQMLCTYLANARAHGAPPVVVTVRERAGRGVVSVADSGPVIPPDQVERLYRRFSRLGSGTGSGPSGSGLGLWIVHGLAVANGGRAWYEQGDDGCNCFCFGLPAVSPGRHAPSSAVQEPAHGRRRILRRRGVRGTRLESN